MTAGRQVRTLAVVGASLAGAKAAEAARDAGFDGRVVLIGEEAGLPYERPPLSKDVLRGEKDPAAARVHPDGFYADRDIELVHDRAVGLDPAARTIALASGEAVAFDTAVLATGSAPRRLDVPGTSLEGVHYLRTVDDAVRLRRDPRCEPRCSDRRWLDRLGGRGVRPPDGSGCRARRSRPGAAAARPR